MKRGEVYWVNLDPTQGAEIKKRRPGIIMSANPINKARRTVIIIPLSTSATPHPPDRRRQINLHNVPAFPPQVTGITGPYVIQAGAATDVTHDEDVAFNHELQERVLSLLEQAREREAVLAAIQRRQDENADDADDDKQEENKPFIQPRYVPNVPMGDSDDEEENKDEENQEEKDDIIPHIPTPQSPSKPKPRPISPRHNQRAAWQPIPWVAPVPIDNKPLSPVQVSGLTSSCRDGLVTHWLRTLKVKALAEEERSASLAQLAYSASYMALGFMLGYALYTGYALLVPLAGLSLPLFGSDLLLGSVLFGLAFAGLGLLASLLLFRASYRPYRPREMDDRTVPGLDGWRYEELLLTCFRAHCDQPGEKGTLYVPAQMFNALKPLLSMQEDGTSFFFSAIHQKMDCRDAEGIRALLQAWFVDSEYNDKPFADYWGQPTYWLGTRGLWFDGSKKENRWEIKVAKEGGPAYLEIGEKMIRFDAAHHVACLKDYVTAYRRYCGDRDAMIQCDGLRYKHRLRWLTFWTVGLIALSGVSFIWSVCLPLPGSLSMLLPGLSVICFALALLVASQIKTVRIGKGPSWMLHVASYVVLFGSIYASVALDLGWLLPVLGALFLVVTGYVLYRAYHDSGSIGTYDMLLQDKLVDERASALKHYPLAVVSVPSVASLSSQQLSSPVVESCITQDGITALPDDQQTIRLDSAV